MIDEMQELIPPKGYQKEKLVDGRSVLVSEESKEEIQLTDRLLSEVDSYFGNLLTTGIKTKMKEAQERKVEILDLGSGTQSLACKEIGKEFGEAVRVSGVDFYPEGSKEANAIQGDIRELPFKTDTFDIIFSVEVLNYLKHNDDEQVVGEINRILKPGGFALLHWDNVAFLDGRMQPHLLQQSERLHLIWKSKILRREGERPKLFHALFKPPVKKVFLEKVDKIR